MHTTLPPWYLYTLIGLTMIVLFSLIQSFRDPQFRPQRKFYATMLGLAISMLYRAIHPSHGAITLYSWLALFAFSGILKLVKRVRRQRTFSNTTTAKAKTKAPGGEVQGRSTASQFGRRALPMKRLIDRLNPRSS
jgi:hypothetical protein